MGPACALSFASTIFINSLSVILLVPARTMVPIRFLTIYLKNPLAQILNISLFCFIGLIFENNTSLMVEDLGLPLFSNDLKSIIPVIA